MKKTITGNWRKNFDYRYISAEDILDGNVTITIKEIGIDEAFNGKTKEDVVAIAFEETDKLMVLNKTNAKTMTKLFNTPKVEKWIGQKITLTATKVQAFGQTVSAIRIAE
jgi:hypothetical protein